MSPVADYADIRTYANIGNSASGIVLIKISLGRLAVYSRGGACSAGVPVAWRSRFTMPETLIMLAYSSVATRDMSDADIADIVALSRRNNAEASITGWLTYANRVFAQVLEGPEAAVLALYEKLKADARHDHLQPLLVEPVERRAFGAWHMTHVPMTRTRQAADAYPAGTPEALLGVLEVLFWRVDKPAA